MLYIVEVTLYTGLMLLVYLLLLRDRPQHRFNRTYLLGTIVIPLVLPLLKLPEYLSPKTNISINTILPDVIIGAQQQQVATTPAWYIVLVGLYGAGVLFSVIAILYSYFKMKAVIKKADKEEGKQFTLLKNTGYGPGSWGKYIFLPEDDVDETIITHELAHIQLQHSKDLLFLNLMRSLLWPNLFLHFIKNELVLVHEFQADATVSMEKEAYAQLLLSSVFSTCALPLSHSFIVHPIKRRIMMLNKNKPISKLRSIIAVAASLVIMMSVITIQSCQTNKAEPKVYDGLDMSALTKMPEPIFDLNKFIGETVKYPEDAKAEGVEGRIAVKFMIDKDGVVKNATIANKEYDARLGEAAMKAVLKMPKWKPGVKDGENVAVYYTIPIKFVLPKEEELKNELVDKLKEKIENGEIDAKGNISKKEVEQRKREISRELDRMEQGFDKNNPPPPPPPPTDQKKVTRVSSFTPVSKEMSEKVNKVGFVAKMDRNKNEYEKAFKKFQDHVDKIGEYPQTKKSAYGGYETVISTEEGGELAAEMSAAYEANKKMNK